MCSFNMYFIFNGKFYYLYYSQYILDTENKIFNYCDKKNISAQRITNFFKRIQRIKQKGKKSKTSQLNFKTILLKKIC